VIAARQRYGHGQRGRLWSAPLGGVWLSAAFPWSGEAQSSLALGLAVGLAEQLETLGLPVRIKWPNDLLLHGRKLAGLLPRLRLRGAKVRWAQAGIGLNGINRVPRGAVSVGEALAPGRAWHPEACPRRLEVRVLTAIDWALRHAAEPELVRREAERRLWSPQEGVEHLGLRWQIAGLESDGGLRLERGHLRTTLARMV
jgi:BirA family biotin operon repressor/biotin-[acetyl-CoA-carboxylase] ligase